ncbi:MAG: class I SAM-dependent methyltransferase [Desulfobacterales bacterium]|nr:class I SAM-dependent methyltransferase [Desulfobacterales bacterium]
MNYYTYFSKQARKPSGLFGRFFMKKLFEKGNMELNSHVYETLAFGKNDNILEIGFGPGLFMKKIADSLTDGFIEGVDFSETMVNIAKKRNRSHIKTGKVKIQSGDFNNVSYAANSFERVFTVNTIYFWQNPSETASKIFEILKPGGKVVVGYHSKEDMENSPLNKDVFKYYATEDVEELFTNANFKDVKTITKKIADKSCYCCIATK